MGKRTRGEIAGLLVRGRDRFLAWRLVRERGARIPESLWTLAVKLAVDHGINHTASVLKLDYYALKKRVESAEPPTDSAAGFVEFAMPVASSSSQASSGECIIELDNGIGGSMRVHLKGHDAPDLLALSRSFWNG